jgi:pimeloyl-ACP methyl ester carboxylesterase
MENVISKDGTCIAFHRYGAGSPIIQVGGAFQHRALDPKTAQLATLLAPHFSVFHYDRRGRGDSGDALPYAVEREVEDVQALIEAAAGSAYVFGMSSGGIPARHAAARFGITRLAVYEPPFLVDETRAPLALDYVARLEALLSSGRRGEAVEVFITEAVGMPAEFVAPMRGMPIWPAFESVAHTLAYDGAFTADGMRGDPSQLQRWASGTVPTLVADGGASPAWMRNAAQALGDVLPNARRTTLEGQTHDVAPEVLAPVLAEFFLS